jgi:hypothetical protein
MKGLRPFSLFIIILSTTGSAIYLPVNAFELTNCAVDQGPRGVAAHNSSSIWVAIETGPPSGGPELEQFTGLPGNCNHPSPITINGADPDFVNVTSTGIVAVTNHETGDKFITYYDPGQSPSLFSCRNSVINEGDKIITYQGAQYFSSFLSGYIIKSVEGVDSCTTTTYALPGNTPFPEGIAYSGQGSALLVVDDNNRKLYLFYPSTGVFSLFFDLRTLPIPDQHPSNIAVDYKNNLVWITFPEGRVVVAIGILSQTLVYTSPSTKSNDPYDIAISGDYEPVFTSNNSNVIGDYDISNNVIDYDDWTSACSNDCFGQGIDVDARTGNYYAALQNPTGSSPDQLVVGATACNPPPSGDWTIDRGCTLLVNTQISGNVYVDSGVRLTVSSNTILNIGLNQHKLVVYPGGGVLIQQGAKID